MNITPKEVNQIREWIKNAKNRINYCPFDDDETCSLCKKHFPKIRKMGNCPCGSYTADHIMRKAQELTHMDK